MTFEEITEAEFRDFANKNPYKSFMQTPEIAKYREENGWTGYYLAAKYSGEIKAASMLVAKPNFLGKSIFIAPGGPLLNLEDQPLLDFFIKSLKKYIKSHNGYALHISPYFEITERDRHGDLVPGGFNHQDAIKNLKNLGFLELKDASQPKYMYALDLKGKTPEELMADFKSNTRGHIRKAEKMGVTVRELAKNELSIFKEITESTSKRREFEDKPLKYYEEMYDLFVPRKEAMFLVAEVSVDSRESGARQREDERRSPVATGRPDAARELTVSYSTNNMGEDWICREINECQKQIEKDMKDYRFAEAVETLYQTIWDKYADWFLESQKIYRNIPLLKTTLERLLITLHPFAPFVTETIWQNLSWTNDLIITKKWPEKLNFDPISAEQFETIRNIVVEVRGTLQALPGTNNVNKYALLYDNDSIVEDNLLLIKALAKVPDINPLNGRPRGLRLALANHELYLDVPESVVNDYKDALTEKILSVGRELDALNARMMNPNYVEKAPEHLVKETQDQIKEKQALIGRLKTQQNLI